MNKTGFKLVYIFIFAMALVVLSGCANKEAKQVQSNLSDSQAENQVENRVAEKIDKPDEINPGQSGSGEDKLCGWIDKSDIVIKLNFADDVVKDTSYEAGFYFSPIYSTMRLARQACDYRTGFNFSELKSKGAAQVGVRGYTDSIRRQLANEPLSVVFDENGVPSIGKYIEVQVLN